MLFRWLVCLLCKLEPTDKFGFIFPRLKKKIQGWGNLCNFTNREKEWMTYLFSVCVAASCLLVGVCSSLAKQVLLRMRKERLSSVVLAEPRVKL